MYPVVIIERTAAGDAYRYSRFDDGRFDYIVDTPVVPVGKPLEILTARDVEIFRTKPETVVE